MVVKLKNVVVGGIQMCNYGIIVASRAHDCCNSPPVIAVII